MRWSIRAADRADDQRIEAFLVGVSEFAGTIVAGEERRIWRWIFGSDSGIDGAYLAEDDDGLVVGHYGAAPWPFWARDRQVRAGFLCKLAIADGYRRTPLFMRLSQKVLGTRFAEGGPEFTVGLVNRPEVMPFHLAFGLNRVGDLPVYAKPLRPERVARQMLSSRAYRWGRPILHVGGFVGRAWLRLLASRPADDLEISPLTTFGPEFDAVDGFLVQHPYRSVRSARTLTHRYLDGPPRRYQPYRVDGPGGLVGYFVLRRMQMKGFEVLALVDICLDPTVQHAPAVVLQFVDRVALDSGVDLVSALAGSSGLRRQLRRGLFLKTPESFTLIVHAGPDRVSETPGRSGHDVTRSTISEWHVTWHESDYV